MTQLDNTVQLRLIMKHDIKGYKIKIKPLKGALSAYHNVIFVFSLLDHPSDKAHLKLIYQFGVIWQYS